MTGADLEAAIAAAIAAGEDPAAAPGLIYERSLSRRERRGGGVYYTPAHVAEATVDRALAPLLSGRGVTEVLSLRVADLACGGGVFAVKVAERLARHCLEHDPAGVEAMGGERRLRVRIVAECVDARDVDGAAASICRLALVRFMSMDETPGDEQRRAMARAADAAVRVGDSLLGDVPAGVDAVVGNPPWGQKAFDIDAATRAALRRRYRTARGPLDPFKLFIERAHELLRRGGRWGLVVPDIVLLKNHEEVRRLMLQGSELDSIIHLGRCFPGVNLDAVILVGERTDEPGADHRVAIWDRLPEPGAGSGEERGEPRFQPQARFLELPGCKLNVHLDEATWQLYRRLRDGPRLGERFEIHEGVHSGNCRDRLFVRERPRGPHAPVVIGRDELSPFRLSWAGTWIDLDPAAIGRQRGGYANVGRPEWYAGPKLVVRRTGDRMVVARAGRGIYVSNNMFILIPREREVEADLLAYLAVVGSSLYTWYFRTEQPRVGRLFAELKIVHLRSFPVPELERWRARRGQLADLGRALEERGPDPVVVADVDAAVAALFDLSPGDRDLVQRSSPRGVRAVR